MNLSVCKLQAFLRHGPCNIRCLEWGLRLRGGNSILEDEELYLGGGRKAFCSKTRQQCDDNSNKSAWMIEEVKEVRGLKLEKGRE